MVGSILIRIQSDFRQDIFSRTSSSLRDKQPYIHTWVHGIPLLKIGEEIHMYHM